MSLICRVASVICQRGEFPVEVSRRSLMEIFPKMSSGQNVGQSSRVFFKIYRCGMENLINSIYYGREYEEGKFESSNSRQGKDIEGKVFS